MVMMMMEVVVEELMMLIVVGDDFELMMMLHYLDLVMIQNSMKYLRREPFCFVFFPSWICES